MLLMFVVLAFSTNPSFGQFFSNETQLATFVDLTDLLEYLEDIEKLDVSCAYLTILATTNSDVWIPGPGLPKIQFHISETKRIIETSKFAGELIVIIKDLVTSLAPINTKFNVDVVMSAVTLALTALQNGLRLCQHNDIRSLEYAGAGFETAAASGKHTIAFGHMIQIGRLTAVTVTAPDSKTPSSVFRVTIFESGTRDFSCKSAGSMIQRTPYSGCTTFNSSKGKYKRIEYVIEMTISEIIGRGMALSFIQEEEGRSNEFILGCGNAVYRPGPKYIN